MSMEEWSIAGMLLGALMMSGSLTILGMSWGIEKLEEYFGGLK